MKKLSKKLIIALVCFVVMISALTSSLNTIAIDDGDPGKPSGIIRIG